jgi:NAD(P)-dependent dehydrogenase (short-subunit alcohol dehydrogenase family)
MPQNNKVALVTGANKGIGFELARQLGRNGVTVLLGARDEKLGEAAANTLKNEGLDVQALKIDLNDPETAKAAAAHIELKYGRLDILVNNAAIVYPGDGLPTVVSLEAIRRTYETNVTGTVAVTQALLPLVRKSASGRIVNVSSGLASLTLSGDPNWVSASSKFLGYAASKAALNMFTVQLAYELRDTAIKVNSADPGYTATDLNGHRGTQTVEEAVVEPLRLALIDDNGPTGAFFDKHGARPW